MKTFKVEDQSIVTELETLNYEIESRKQVIAYILSTNTVLQSDAAIQYQKELIDFMKKYEAKKNEFYNKYVLPQEQSNHYISWDLNFFTKEVTLSEGVN